MKKWFYMVVLLFLLTACQQNNVDNTDEVIQKINLPMGYIPNIQYAPFYVAVDKGYFADNGFEIDFDYSFETDGLALVGTGEVPFALVSGEQVIMARSHEIPIVYVFAWFQEFPTAIIALKETGIESPEDLIGSEIGLPGLFGASYIGLKAIFNKVGISEDDVKLNAIGFNQVQLVVGGKEKIIVGYDTNELIQLEEMGYDVNVFSVSDYVQLAANGIITNEDMIENHPEQIRAFNLAFKKGLEYTINNPDEAFEISKKYVEGLEDLDESIQKIVLAKSIEYWVAENLGYSSPEAWKNMLNVLLSMQEIDGLLDLSKAFSNDFIE